MRAILENKILSWCGLYVFDIYILQRLPMNFGKYFHWNEQNPYLLRLLQFVWRGWEESKQRFSPFPRVATPCNSRISAGPCPACSSCS